MHCLRSLPCGGGSHRAAFCSLLVLAPLLCFPRRRCLRHGARDSQERECLVSSLGFPFFFGSSVLPPSSRIAQPLCRPCQKAKHKTTYWLSRGGLLQGGLSGWPLKARSWVRMPLVRSFGSANVIFKSGFLRGLETCFVCKLLGDRCPRSVP